MAVNDRNGPLVASFPVEPTDQVMLVSDGGQIIRIGVDDIRIIGRGTQGVIVFDTAEGEKVVSVERLTEDDTGKGENGNGGNAETAGRSLTQKGRRSKLTGGLLSSRSSNGSKSIHLDAGQDGTACRAGFDCLVAARCRPRPPAGRPWRSCRIDVGEHGCTGKSDRRCRDDPVARITAWNQEAIVHSPRAYFPIARGTQHVLIRQRGRSRDGSNRVPVRCDGIADLHPFPVGFEVASTAGSLL